MVVNDSDGAEPSNLNELISSHQDFEITELDKSGNFQRRWLHTKDQQVRHVSPSTNDSISHFFRDCFLPAGFPYSVTKDYLAYQLCDSLQAFFSTIISLLASRALLQGLGVGDASSSATFAIFLTIVKDGTARVATVIFAYSFGLRIEPDAKRYRFLADVFNDTAFFLELYSPYLGSWGKVIALATGEGLRALCSVAAGASKAALSVHFAKHDNLAELNAKEASQETAVGLIGLLVGSIVVKRIENHDSVFYLMIMLVFAHLLTNYIGVRSVCMNTLNRQRATILITEYLRIGNVLSPREVAKRESIIFWDPVMSDCEGRFSARVEFARNYAEAVDRRGQYQNIIVLDGEMHTKFICTSDDRGHLPCIKMLLWKGAQAKDAIRAWFGAVEIAWVLGGDRSSFRDRFDQMVIQQHPNSNKLEPGVRCSHPYLWETMAAKGWNLETHGLETTAPVRLDIHGTISGLKKDS